MTHKHIGYSGAGMVWLSLLLYVLPWIDACRHHVSRNFYRAYMVMCVPGMCKFDGGINDLSDE